MSLKIVVIAIAFLFHPPGFRQQEAPTTPTISTTKRPCNQDEFNCTFSKECIPKFKRCDKNYDCSDKSDELDCLCNETTEFRCKSSGICINIARRCDGAFQCSDRSDEDNCPTGPSTISTTNILFPPPTTIKIITDWLTTKSPVSTEPKYECRPDQIRCYDNACINSDKRCDGVPDCSRGEDEQGCPSTAQVEENTTISVKNEGSCLSIEFQCKNGTCVSDSYRCDGFTDCIDASDEENCTVLPNVSRNCLEDEYECGQGHCIPIFRRCDGSPDCRDGEDEKNCPRCQSDEFKCDDGHCIPYYRRCDGRSDCRDNSDEYGCTTTTTTTTTPPPFRCTAGEFRCADRHCIPGYRRCDGIPDCRDYTDELGCPPVTFPTTTKPTTTTEDPNFTSRYPFCRLDEFTCTNFRQCIPSSARCNGVSDCIDRTDELYCEASPNELRLKAYPYDQIIKESQEVVFQCRDEGSLRSPVTWTRGNGLPLPVNSRINQDGRLEIPNIQLSHSGEYVCKAVGQYSRLPGSEIKVHLQVEPFVAITYRPPKACGFDEATCLNGDCIRKEFVCNGRFDCADGSDEMRCNPLGCEPNQFRCSNGRCIQKNWRCDGEDDCKDRSDEQNCTPSPPGSPCRYDEFKCASVNQTQCIPKSYQCDSTNDCYDGSDEIGCAAPTIVQAPPSLVTLNEGDVFNVTCISVGIPTPEVLWRLNWGHVPAKCTSTSANGFGVLTCYNIQKSDGGAYSCEAINSKGSTFAKPDVILVVNGGTPTGCPAGQFNDLAVNTNDCITCFCFGATTQCSSANLYVFQVLPPLNQFSVVKVYFESSSSQIDFNSNELVSLRTSILSADSFQVKDVIDYTDPNTYPYLSLPSTYYGNQLKSYGGFIKYNVRYESSGSFLSIPIIIISGNGYKIFHNGTQYFANNGTQEIANQNYQVSVRLFYGAWFKEGNRPGGDLPAYSEPSLATREEIMMVLVNVEQILLKLQYTDTSAIDTIISNFKLDSAGATNTGLGKAAFVEECKCPAGYGGLSCESCAPGYIRRTEGLWLGQCYRPESCAPGTYGDPLRGIPCQPCPCPGSNPSNQFGRTCYRDYDGEPTCNCPPGYSGRRCETCSPGFTGNPLIPGDYCKKSACDPAGSLSLTPDPRTGQCTCKDFTTGYYCNQCKANAFYLAPSNVFGCISCFCMGVTQDCFSSRWYRQLITTSFVRSTEDFKIAARPNLDNPISQLQLRPDEREIVFSSFGGFNQGVYYWVLPQRYLGDKVTSYGGVLNYTLRYVPSPGGQSSRNNAPEIEIISNNEIRLLYFKRDDPLQPNVFETVSVPMLEQYWQREDGQPANREYFLMALAGLNTILIKATYTTTTQEVGLQSVTLEIADERNTGLRRAYEVEECRCPVGYRGLSCQECDAGYYRVDHGLYLGLCEPCNCHGHSRDCDVETGVCLNCGNHTTGNECELCEPGYTGDPSSGGICTPTNYGCTCDPRGSLSSDCYNNNQCNCKSNVVGFSCDACKSGTFDLQRSHPTGCLDCWCSGVTNQCQSSNLFVTQIPMPIVDANHGFTLTESDRRRVINTGFRFNIAQNQIGYDYTLERGQRLYWSLPTQFTGNKVTSYGGNLTWTQGSNAPQGAIPDYDTDLVIYGGGISIFWSNNVLISPNTNVTTSVKLEENGFTRLTSDGRQRASRSDILRVLSYIEAILIRASFASQTSFVFISDVSLDTAVAQPLSSVRATQVEACRCPTGYRGLSCETCSTGYYRDDYNGRGSECRKCPCNGNEESCYLGNNAQVVCKCLAGFTGSYCEDGYTNNGTSGDPGQVYSTTQQPAPTISITIREPSIQIVALGSTVRYNCKAQSLKSKPVTVRWSKEGGSLPPGRSVDDGNGYLVLLSAIASDSGTYICTAFDGESYVSRPIVLTVGESSTPKVSLVPNGNQELTVGESLSVSCEATGIPPPTVEWARADGVPVNIKSALRSSVFTINSVRRSDEGTYYCRATNNAGSDAQQITIRVVENGPAPGPDPADVRVSIRPSEIYGSTGETIRLECIPSVTSFIRIRWTRNGDQPLPSSADQREGLLLIYNASPADSGVYVCNAESEITGVVLSRSEASVTIGRARRPPLLTIEPERQMVSQGGVAVIRCLADDPSARITWTKVNEVLPTYAQSYGSELRIPQVQVKDRGVYVCEATNSVGTSQTSAYLEVQRREPPSVEIYPKDSQVVELGGSALIQCRVTSGEPTPTLRWSRPNNLSLSEHVEQIDGVLRFTEVTAADAGQYICTAENQAGFITAIAVLEIISPPTITLSPRGPYTVLVGQPVRIDCLGRGKPPPSVTWTRNRPLPYAQPPFRLESYAVFAISSAQLSDTGVYTCIASSSAGQVEEKIQLTVIDPGSGIPNLPTLNFTTIESSIAPDEEILFPMGTNANLRCSVGSTNERINIRWSREDAELPESHQIYNEELILYNADRSAAGKYICTGIGNDGEILFSKTFNVRIVGLPQISLNPRRQVVRPGDNAQVLCTAWGDPPIVIRWSTIGDGELPRTGSEDGGLLQFRGITPADAGMYLCTASNVAGEAKAVAEVRVEISQPTVVDITAVDRHQSTFEGSDLDLRCTVNHPSVEHRITWRRERAPLPSNSRISGNTLHLVNLRAEDSDRYICEVTSVYGTRSDYIDVQVDRINNISLSIEASKDDVKVGDTVTLLCNVNGEMEDNIAWSKVGTSLGNNVKIDKNILTIADIQVANAGIYRCSVLTSRDHKYVDYNIPIQLSDGIAPIANVETKTANYGQNIDFNCTSDLDPPVNYSWLVHSYDKSQRRIINSDRISIPNLSVNESGLYICTISNAKATIIIPRVLVVNNVVPAFAKTSYLAFKPMVHATHNFLIEITFRPKSSDGLILYNGQKADGNGDYVSFGLNYGIPEFRFDVGSGPAVIKGYAPLKLNTWHTVRLIRNVKNGIMEIDGRENFTGSSPGSFETLDLQMPLYIGGLPNAPNSYNTTGFKIGFDGCINRFLIDNKNIDLKKDAFEAKDTVECNGCDDNPCMNRGVCQQTPTTNGYTCFCVPGYSGERCQLEKRICYLDSCGTGKCIEGDNGIECQCPIGKTGEGCKKNVDIETPAFTKNSFLAFATPLVKKKFKLFIKIKPVGESYVDDGLIFYIAQSDDGLSDFISLSVVNGFPVLKARIMSRDVHLRSNHYLVHNEKVTVNVTMDAAQILFSVGDVTIAEEYNPGESSDLRLFTPLYIGGYDKQIITLPDDLPVKAGFHGCVSALEISGINIKLLKSHIDSANVNDCYSTFGDICRRTNPCQNDGICLTTRETYKCECAFSYSGRNCERQRDVCEILTPCQNNGKCISTPGSYKCYCGLGYSGSMCELRSEIEEDVKLTGDGYVELSGSLLPRDEVDKSIEIAFSTNASDALLFWHGQNEGVNGRDYDYIALSIRNGYVILDIKASQDLKSLRATDHKVNDGKKHKVLIGQQNQAINLELDRVTTDFNTIEPIIDTTGNIFIGGLPDIKQMTGNLFSKGFTGCIHSLTIQDVRPINFRQKAVSARNAAPCSNPLEYSNAIY